MNATKNTTETSHGDLMDYTTGEYIRLATNQAELANLRKQIGLTR